MRTIDRGKSDHWAKQSSPIRGFRPLSKPQRQLENLEHDGMEDDHLPVGGSFEERQKWRDEHGGRDVKR